MLLTTTKLGQYLPSPTIIGVSDIRKIANTLSPTTKILKLPLNFVIVSGMCMLQFLSIFKKAKNLKIVPKFKILFSSLDGRTGF